MTNTYVRGKGVVTRKCQVRKVAYIGLHRPTKVYIGLHRKGMVTRKCQVRILGKWPT